MAASVPVEAKHRQEAKTLGCTPKTNTGGGELCRAREGRGGATYGCLLMLGLSLRLLVAQWSIEVHLCPQEESMMRQGHTQPPWLFCSKLGQLWVHVQLLEPIQKGPCTVCPFPQWSRFTKSQQNIGKDNPALQTSPVYTHTRVCVLFSQFVITAGQCIPSPQPPG